MNNEEKLNAACYEVARTTMWSRKPIDAKQIQSHADSLHKETMKAYDCVSELGCDLPMLIRAVMYIHQSHAIPPMRTDTVWFYNILSAVLEVACPNIMVSDAAKDFLVDMKNGINGQLNE